MKIGFDAMGGDLAPVETIQGAILSLDDFEGEIILYGDEQKIISELAKYKFDTNRINIVHTTEVINNDDKPVKAIKSKGDSSMVVGLKALRKGVCICGKYRCTTGRGTF